MTLNSLLTIVSLLFTFVSFANAAPCIAMDANFNLLIFGLGDKDFNAGTQDTWTTETTPTDITTSGRPPFDTPNVSCYLSQFSNAIYVLSGDSSKPTSVYVYDPTAKSWSVQSVSPSSGSPAFDPTNAVAILDHDTNVFYALSGEQLFFLDFSNVTKAASSSALSWTGVGQPPFATPSYQPVMALAQNHIHFVGLSSLQPGQADIFVIHFSFFQPDAQSYPAASGNNFPQQHGQATSFFQESGVQQEFAYIPDDGSATYVINVETNTTQTLSGPSSKDPKATYFAGITSLVQIDSKGAVSFIPYKQGDGATNSAAQWTSILSSLPPPQSSSTATGSSSSKGTSTGTATGTKSTGSAKPTSASSSDAVSQRAGLLGSALLAGVSLAMFLRY